MRRYTKSVALYETSSTKIPDEGAQVKVYLSTNPQFTTLATLFSDDDGTVSLAQPFLTNTLAQQNPGQFTFVVADGIYDIVVNENLGLTNQSVIASEKIFSQAVIPVIPVLPDIDIDNIRYSKLQHSLLDILNTNELEGVINGSVSWVRSTTATYKDIYKITNIASTNTPRYEKKGWLNEGDGENISTFSSELQTSIFNNDGAVISPNVAIAPDGTMTADEIDISADTMNTRLGKSVISVPQGFYTCSISLKSTSGTGTWPLRLISQPGSPVDLLAEIVDFEWRRFELTVELTSTGNVLFYYGNNQVSSNTLNVSYASEAQLEKSCFATSHMPTGASAEIRGIDIVTAPTDNNAPLLEDPLRLIINFTPLGLLHDDLRTIAHISSGLLISNGTSLYIEENGNISVYLRGALTATSTAVTPGVEMAIALSYDGTDAQLYVNGVEVSETILVGAETGKPLRIGVGTQNLGVARSLFGNINTFKISDTPINADEAKFIS